MMRSKNVTRWGVQEIFSMVDLNNSATIEATEWKTF